MDCYNNLHEFSLNNFWSIGCKGCVMEIPDLNKVVEHYKNNTDVEFYAFASDNNSKLIGFLRRKSFKYTIIPTSYRINVLFDIHVYPSTVIINKKGKAVTYIRRPVTSDELIQEIDKFLEEK